MFLQWVDEVFAWLDRGKGGTVEAWRSEGAVGGAGPDLRSEFRGIAGSCAQVAGSELCMLWRKRIFRSTIKGILRVLYAMGQLGRRKGERMSFLIRLRQVLGRVSSGGSGVKSARTT